MVVADKLMALVIPMHRHPPCYVTGLSLSQSPLVIVVATDTCLVVPSVVDTWAIASSAAMGTQAAASFIAEDTCPAIIGTSPAIDTTAHITATVDITVAINHSLRVIIIQEVVLNQALTSSHLRSLHHLWNRYNPY